jgi:hypothetical protein
VERRDCCGLIAAVGSLLRRTAVNVSMPFCDMFSVIDRFNIGFAKLQFMQDLSLNEATVGVAAGAFYVGFDLPII